MKALFPSAIVAFVVVSACGKSEPGACFRDRDGACSQFGRDQASAAQKLCKGMRWIPGTNACPADNRLGTCIKEGGKTNEYLYGGPPNNFTKPAAKNTCEFAGGVFITNATSLPSALPPASSAK